MALQIWLPLNKDIRNQGLIPNMVKPSTIGSPSMQDGGPNGKYLRVNTTSAQTVNGLSFPTNLVSELGRKFSVSVWVNPNGQHQHYEGTIISSGNWNSKRWAFGVSQDNSKVDVFGPNHNCYVTCSVPVGQWTHLVSTFDDGIGKLYKNGAYVGSYNFNATVFSSDTTTFTVGRETYASGYFCFNGSISDLKIYNHVLNERDAKNLYNKSFEVLGGLYLEGSANLGGSSIMYNGKTYGQEYAASSWGGDAGKVKFFKEGGYNNLPYKEYHKTATGSGGIYGSTTADITIKSGKTYTMSIWVKADRNFTDNAYSFNINGVIPSNSNHYITYGKNIPFTTEWTRLVKTFTTTSAEVGTFKEMSIVYNDTVATDYYVYYSGFQLEENDHATDFTFGSRDARIVNITGKDDDIVPYNIIQSGSSMYFNGVDAAIKVPIYKIISGGTWSINLWFYRPNGQYGSKAWETLIGGQSGFELSSKNGTGTSPKLQTYSWTNSGYTYDCDKWNMVTLTRNSSGAKVYLNGELKHNGTAGSMPTGDYFIGAWKTYTQQNFKGYIKKFSVYKSMLSESEVKDLYNNGN